MQCPSTDIVDSFASMNGKWLANPVVMDYNSLSEVRTLVFYTSPRSAYCMKYYSELYGTKRYIARNIANIPVNFDPNIQDLRITLNDNQLTTCNVGCSYPKVYRITIHSQTSILPAEQTTKSKYDQIAIFFFN